jgi:hypothetical protein
VGSTFSSPAALAAGKLKEEGKTPFILGINGLNQFPNLLVQTVSRFVTATA